MELGFFPAPLCVVCKGLCLFGARALQALCGPERELGRTVRNVPIARAAGDMSDATPDIEVFV